MRKYVQIGAGSSNLDKNFKDGFTNFLKQNNKKAEIFIVEANSIHLKKLKKIWKRYKKTQIFNFAIIPDNINQKKMTFFYSEKDSPDFQIFSNSIRFVRKHFTTGKIRRKIVKCKSLSVFLEQNFLKKIDFLSLDIEGMDYEVIKNFNFKRFDIKNISFEHLHLSFFEKIMIIYKLTLSDYFFSGMGFDLRKSNWMFTKNYKKFFLKTLFLPITPRRIWKKYDFSEFLKK